MTGAASWWRRRPPVDETRWVMVDVEASGLYAARDRLLAIAALAIRVDWGARRLAIDHGDSFEAVLRQEEPSTRENILLHGIGVQRQREGIPVPEAMRAFAAYAGQSPLLAFHAAFDQTLVMRHAKGVASGEPAGPWLDIEPLCGAAHPEVAARSLDEWMGHFGITCAYRHDAAADTLAQAELLLRVWPRVAPECRSWRDVERFARRDRWLARR